MKQLTILALCCVIALISASEDLVLHDILSRFGEMSSRVLPRRPSRTDEALEVQHGLTLLSVIDVKEMEGAGVADVTLNVWENMVWTDYRLEWFAFNNNLHSVRVLPSDIWIPDLRLYNSLDAQTRPGHNFVVVTNDGTLDYIFPVNHRVRCPVEGNIVTCTLKVGSWTYSGAVLNLTSKDVDLSSYVARNDFELVTATVEREILQYKCCPEPYISLKYVITLEKQR